MITEQLSLYLPSRGKQFTENPFGVLVLLCCKLHVHIAAFDLSIFLSEVCLR